MISDAGGIDREALARALPAIAELVDPQRGSPTEGAQDYTHLLRARSDSLPHQPEASSPRPEVSADLAKLPKQLAWLRAARASKEGILDPCLPRADSDDRMSEQELANRIHGMHARVLFYAQH